MSPPIWRTAVPLLAILFAVGINSQAPLTHAARAVRARPPVHTGFPPYDAVYGTATHNSYWIERDRLGEKLAHGTQERLLDQLLHDRVRALELDVHFNSKQPGVFSVYHTDSLANTLCSPLDECLKQLQLFQYLEPRHDVVNVVIELKELWGHIFGPTHTIEDLDATLRRYLGDALYTPREFLSRCPPANGNRPTLRECAREHGWPTIDALRGRFIVNVLGNFNYNANDWVDYATKDGGVAARAGFPMRSILRDNGDGATGVVDEGVHDAFDPAAVAAARAASIFWQVERLDYPELDDFLAAHGIVRARSSQSRPEQLERIRRGFQLVQTDHPWHVIEDGKPLPSAAVGELTIDPSRRLRDFGAVDGTPAWPAESLIEPGARLYAIAASDAAPLAALADVPPGDSRWETAPSTTRPRSGARAHLSLWPPRLWWDTFPSRARPHGAGCLRAQSSDGAEWFMICREVRDGELTRVSVRWRHRGDAADSERAFDAATRTAGRVGDLIALEIDEDGGTTRARAASASEMNGAVPAWNELASERFPVRLERQGLWSTRDVLFAGTRHDGNFVRGSDLQARGGSLVDLSHF